MSESDQSGAGRREVAYRLFAAEYDDATVSYSESDQERAPNYVITPTGARVNRLFVVGVLTEVEPVSDDVLRGRVVDPTGAFVLYAGQYQPDEQAFLEGVDTPTFVAVTGKARTFQPEDAQQVYTSIRPESINEVSATTRDRWTVQTAEQTLDRLRHMSTALTRDESGDTLESWLKDEGVDSGLAAGIPLALDRYGTTPAYLDALRETALDAARVVAGDRDEARDLTTRPDEAGSATSLDLVESLPAKPLVAEAAGSPESKEAVSTDAEPASSVSNTGHSTTETTVSTTGDSDSETTASSHSGTETGDASAPDPEPPEPTTQDSGVADSSTESSETGGPADGTDTSSVDSGGTDVAETGTEDLASEEPTGTATTTESTTGTSPSGDQDDELGDFDPGEYELDSEEREQIEQEYGTQFQTGTEVEEPGEADIDVPEPAAEEPGGESEEETGTAPPPETEEPADQESAQSRPQNAEEQPSAAQESDDSAPTDGDDTHTGDGERPDDVQTALVDLMETLDDGNGAGRDELVAEMADRYGLDAEETEEAIQQALMDGKCYEPDDTTLKPI